MDTFTCSKCNETKPVATSGGTGYATMRDTDAKVCYACVADLDRATMIATGKSQSLPLYLIGSRQPNDLEVTNWPGSLRFKVTGMYTTRHNWGGKKTHIWFNGPDGHVWYGYQIGYLNEICHCRRTKALACKYPAR
jgi:hypothetical protein